MTELRNLLFSRPVPLLAAAALLVLDACAPHPGGIAEISPDTFVQGQGNVQVSISGDGFHVSQGMPLVVFDEGDNDGLTGTVDTWADQQIVVTVSVNAIAALGRHEITVGSEYNVYSAHVNVTCNPPASCPSAPDLVDVNPIGEHIKQGKTTSVVFRGNNFQNNVPMVEFDSQQSGLSVPPGTMISVLHIGDLDIFTVPVTVTDSAPTGCHRVRVRTAGGRSEWQDLSVKSSVIEMPPPDSIPTLESVTPSNVGAGVGTFIECHGRGFGVNREVITNPVTPPGGTPPPLIPAGTYPVANSEADGDTIVVARIQPGAGQTIVKVQVKNLDNNQLSDDIRIFVDPVAASAPVANNNANGSVQRGGSYRLQISGQNLGNLSDASWTGPTGLTFSATDPTTASVTVTADSTAPLTGNAATNLQVTTTADTSFPFSFTVLPSPTPNPAP